MKKFGFPEKQGLYNPDKEHDSCGFGFVANIKNQKSHAVVEQGLSVLGCLTHRGGAGADPLAGDGAGILIQIPDKLLREECNAVDILLPLEGEYGVGMIFLPRDEKARIMCEEAIESLVIEEGLSVLGWRDLPTDNSWLSDSVCDIEPFIRQIFIGKTVGASVLSLRALAVIEKDITVSANIAQPYTHVVMTIDDDVSAVQSIVFDVYESKIEVPATISDLTFLLEMLFRLSRSNVFFKSYPISIIGSF